MPLKQPYFGFARWLQPEQHRTTGNVVVSFNWDVLVEQALRDTTRWFQYDARPSGCVPILKPHASINWNAYRRHSLTEVGDPRTSEWEPITGPPGIAYRPSR